MKGQVITMANFNMTKIDLFNAKNASMNIKDYIGETLTVTGCATSDDDGKPIGYIVASGIGVFGVTSATLIEAIDSLVEFFNDGATTVDIIVKSNESKSGKTFYTMQIVSAQ